MPKNVHLEYVAMLKERAGSGTETVRTEARTTACLYRELAERHGWPWPHNALRSAVNDRIAPWTHELGDGDRIVFLPPSSGG